MRIDRNTWNIEGITQNHIGGLASDARQLNQVLHVARHLAGMFFYYLPAAGNDVPGFIAKETGGLNGLFQLLLVCFSESLNGWIAGEKRWGHQIDSNVGALSR